MGSPKTIQRPKSHLSKPILILAVSITGIAFLFLFSSFISTTGFSFSSPKIIHYVFNNTRIISSQKSEKFLYWGYRIDCPGKHCDTCAGLGHQESSLRCALEEAMFLQRTFVMPARMCINPIHNKKGALPQSSLASSDDGWMDSSCAMDSLYDLDLISSKIPVILDNSEMWQQVLSKSMKLGARGMAHVEGVNRADLKEDPQYANLLLINRTASPLAWFVECKDRLNHSAVTLPYDFLPSMATKKLRDVADKIKATLGDYDAVHVRRGDILKTRKDRFGVERSRHPHVERDTRPECMLQRIAKWIPPGRTLFIASNERKPGYFSPLGVRYRLAYSSNYSSIVDPVIENNYQLFMLERLIMMGAKTFINTFKTDESDLSLSDDPKKNTGGWMKVVRTEDC
ncbi:DNA-directed RNA polymerase subunit beta' [Bienertia sinuspersici]